MTVMAVVPTSGADAGEQFEQLYRSSAADVYAYVASLLRDRAAAEDVTALAFERAFRRRALFDVHRGTRAGMAVRDRPQRRAGRAAAAPAHRRVAA
jgi:DNA-directed RNA polymerase specialized sigma24 family protein